MAPARESGGTRRRTPSSRRGLSGESELLGGAANGGHADGWDALPDDLELPRRPVSREPDPRALRELIPSAEPGRAVDDWGRSQRVFDLIEPVLDFYYRYWFRVEQRGIEHVPSEGGALLVSNHSGALPPDAPM